MNLFKVMQFSMRIRTARARGAAHDGVRGDQQRAAHSQLQPHCNTRAIGLAQPREFFSISTYRQWRNRPGQKTAKEKNMMHLAYLSILNYVPISDIKKRARIW